jgi:hypothetical protein
MYERGEQEEAAMKRKLRIDLNELDMALNFGISAFSHYLDLHTGRVLRVDDMDWTPQSLLQQRGDACEWKRDVLLDAARVAFDGQGRYLAIEPGDPYRDHDDMLTFVATLEDEGRRPLPGPTRAVVCAQGCASRAARAALAGKARHRAHRVTA